MKKNEAQVDFKRLPLDVQEKVKDDLRWYDDMTVWYTASGFEVTPHTWLDGRKKVFIGDYRADEIFTKEERALNYKMATMIFGN